MEMLPPISGQGTVGFDYLVSEFVKGAQVGSPGDLYRIMAIDEPASGVDVTIVAAPGAVQPSPTDPCPAPLTSFNLASAGDWCEVYIEGGAHIYNTSGDRFRVMQHSKSFSKSGSGDPSMMQLVPTTAWLCQHRLFSFSGFNYDPILDIQGSYVNVIAPTSSLGTTLLDGQPLSLPIASGGRCEGYSPRVIPTTSFSWTRCLLPDPTGQFGDEHTLEGRDPSGRSVPVAAYVYGHRPPQGAYAYPAGIGKQE